MFLYTNTCIYMLSLHELQIAGIVVSRIIGSDILGAYQRNARMHSSDVLGGDPP